MRKLEKTNPNLIQLIRFLRKKSRENKAKIWRDIAKRLAKPRRNYKAVNISRLNRCTKNKETVIVPGKVVGTGEIDHQIAVAAFAFSEKAREKIKAAKGKIIPFPLLIKKNPQGSEVKIIG